MLRKILLSGLLLGAGVLLTGCVTPYVSGSIGTSVGRGGYIGGSIGGYPYGYGGYGSYGRHGYGGGSVYGYDRYGRPVYRLPDGRLLIGGGAGYGRYYGAPGYGGYGYPRYGGYGYPGYYGYPGGYRYPPRHSRPPVYPHDDRPPMSRPGGDSGVPTRPIGRRSEGGNSQGDVLRQARRIRDETRQQEP